jgi:hypothetical protein
MVAKHGRSEGARGNAMKMHIRRDGTGVIRGRPAIHASRVPDCRRHKTAGMSQEPSNLLRSSFLVR